MPIIGRLIQTTGDLLITGELIETDSPVGFDSMGNLITGEFIEDDGLPENKPMKMTQNSVIIRGKLIEDESL